MMRTVGRFGRQVSLKHPNPQGDALVVTHKSETQADMKARPFTGVSAEGGIRPGVYAGFWRQYAICTGQARSRASSIRQPFPIGNNLGMSPVNGADTKHPSFPMLTRRKRRA
jgi:hypothetical protein